MQGLYRFFSTEEQKPWVSILFETQEKLNEYLDTEYPNWVEKFGGTILNQHRISVGWISRPATEDPCPACPKGSVCRTIMCGRLKK